LVVQARRLYLDGKYQEAEDLSKIILDEWPKSEDARLIMSKSIRRNAKKLQKDLRVESDQQWQRSLEKIRSSSIAYAEWLNYSPDWLEIEARRQQSSGQIEEEPEWERMMRQKMEKRVTLHLPDNTLNEATEMMREQTGVNFYIDRGLDLQDARITDLHLNEVRMAAALELILNNVPSESPLLYQFRDEVVFVTSKENQGMFNRPLQLLYDVTDLVTSFGEYTLGEGEGLRSGEALGGVSEGTSSTEPLSTETLIDLIQVSIDPESWQADGVSVTEYEAGKIVISHSLEVHEQIQELLEMFRKQQKLQVSIEARFITSNDNDLFDLGIEWKGLPELKMEDSAGQVGAGTYSKRTNADVDTRVATVMGSAADSVVSGTPLFISENRNSQGFNAEISVLDPIRANLVMHALERKSSTKNLVAPRLTVINNRQGYFINTRDTSYVRNFTSEEGNIVPEVDRVSNGELLVVRPTVSSDKKYVTLDLSPQVTRLLGLEPRNLTLPVRRNGNGNNSSGSTPTEIVNVTVELPNLEVWQIQTRVQVPDGGVVFVGGRMGNTERKTTRAVPLLSTVPFVGRLFRSDGDYNELENLIISVRAKILVFDELESKLH
jgi:type II secretory pathway component GspD/PulD (secretin)